MEAVGVHCRTQEEGRNQVSVCTLCSPEHSCLSDQHIPQLNAMVHGAEIRIQKCNICGLAAATVRQKTKITILATSFHPPRTRFPATFES